MAQALTAVPKLRFSEPRHNLPGRKGVATAEDRFTIAFMRAYLNQAEHLHRRTTRTQMAFAREIPVNGYGIADLLVVAWAMLPGERFHDAAAFVSAAAPCSRAFECKLTDWRRAMSQAIRYRFFANQTFVVLPPDSCRRALGYLDTFRTIRVGLWEFSLSSGRITAHHTPRRSVAMSQKHYLHAVELVVRASKLALPIR